MEDDQAIGLAELKKQKKKLHRIIKRNRDDNLDDGRKRTMFEVDFSILKEGLDPELLSQIKELVADTKSNFDTYKAHMEYQDNCKKEGPTKSELKYCSRQLTSSEVQKYCDFGAMDIEPAVKELLEKDCTAWEREPIGEGQSLEFLKTLYKLPYLNHSTIVKRLRKVPLLCMILKSPYLRGELDYMFDKWLESFETLVRNKFCGTSTKIEDKEPENSLLDADQTIEHIVEDKDSSDEDLSLAKILKGSRISETPTSQPKIYCQKSRMKWTFSARSSTATRSASEAS
jgi:hypothetical protein